MRVFSITIIFLVLLLPEMYGQKKFGLYGEVMRSQNILTLNKNVDGEIRSENKFGFGLGASIHLKEENNISIRFSGGLTYLTEEVSYSGSGAEELKRGAISFKAPVHTLFKLAQSNFRFVAGINPSLDLVGGKDKDNILNFNAFNIAADIGLNYGFRVGKLTIAPELKYSYSLVNGLDNSSHYAGMIDRYLRNRFVLTTFLTW